MHGGCWTGHGLGQGNWKNDLENKVLKGTLTD